MLSAVNAVKEGMSCNAAASVHGIPEPTLRRYLKTADEVNSYINFIFLPVGLGAAAV